MKPLAGKVAVVAGATRGAGRGIARMLGEAGARVYCTGRSIAGHSPPGRPETIDETAELVNAAGGSGVAVRVDHMVEEQVRQLFARVRRDEGRLDLLVNDIWGGDPLTEWGKRFWEQDFYQGRRLVDNAVYTHILTSRHGVPLMLESGGGLVVEVTDGDFLGYRGSFFYDLAKASVIRLAYAMALELRERPVTAVAITPGFMRSEAVLDHFSVREENWRDGITQDRHFAASETPCYVGRAVARLAADPNARAYAGQVLSSWRLAHTYGFHDIDGRQPDWGHYFDGVVEEILARGGPRNDDERSLLVIRHDQIHLDPAKASQASRIKELLHLGGP
jgi:NAD(P)-dependent dehydrogenase (short-subunit alcohol dehydrogenase family)